MPRTKKVIEKNQLTARDFGIQDENPIAMLELCKKDAFYEIIEKLNKFIGAIPPEVLNMKIRDLRMLNNLGLEFDYSKIEDKISKLGQVAVKYEQKANECIISTKGVPEKLNTSIGPKKMMILKRKWSELKKKIPEKKASSKTLSMKTPENSSKAISFLRHAKSGETIYAATGSPVICSNFTEQTATVNIPVESGGFLSIRPHLIKKNDAYLTSKTKIHPKTIEQLATLKMNLDIVIENGQRF